MTQKKIDKLIEQFKKDHIKYVSDKMLREGEMGPMITVLAMKKSNEKMGLVYAPIMGEFSEERKEEVVSKVIPYLFEQMKEEDLIPYCFSFSSEVIMKVIDTDKEEIPDDLSKIAGIDALLITFETKTETSTKVFNMEKVGKAINEDGEMIDQIKLTYHEMPEGGSFGGRFTNIFKRYEQG